MKAVTREEISKRLQFMVTLSFFFPVLLQAFLNTAPNPPKASALILGWGLVIAFFILSYLLVEITESFYPWVLRSVNILLLLQIFAFVVIIYAFAKGDTQLDFASTLLYGPNYLGIIYIPALVFLLLLINPALAAWRSFVALLEN